MNLGNWLAEQARHSPNRPALFCGTELVADYGTFHDRAARVSAWLRDKGIGAGDRVAVFMSNCPEYLIVFYGIWYAGAVAVPINAKLHGREADYILQDSGALLCFATSEQRHSLSETGSDCALCDVSGDQYAEALECVPDRVVATRQADDLAWLFYTSGTTGKPKGVMITHRMLMTMSLAYQTDVDHVRPEDAVLYAAPMSHGAGIYNVIHVRMGARHVCPVSEGFDAAEVLELSKRLKSVQMFAAPTMVKRLTETAKATGEAGKGLRTVVYAGGPMYQADIIEAVDQFGPVFVQIYGQGECPMGITALSRDDVADRDHANWQDRLASVGRAQSPVDVRIGGLDGQILVAGEVGEILVRGDVVMPGYWQNPEATEKTIVNGWLRTGDMGVIDEQGYVTLRDRSKDMIITGGSNVYPREVEEVLLTHPHVREVSVVGQPDANWGEIVVAFVVGEADTEDLDRLCLNSIARFKRPKTYIRLEDLPKNNYGKVLKTELRTMLAQET